MAQTSSGESSFNMGVSHLIRIDSLLSACAGFAFDKEYVSWFEILQILNREVFFLYNKDEMDANNKLNNSCATALEEYMKEKTDYKKLNYLYNCLINYELFIKGQLAQRKMLMSFTKDKSVSIADLY